MTLPIKHVYMCVVCSVTYDSYHDARDCCVKISEWDQCEYCEQLFRTWEEAKAHLINGKCPKEIENES